VGPSISVCLASCFSYGSRLPAWLWIIVARQWTRGTHRRASGKRTPSEHIVAHQVKGHRQSTSSRIREKDTVRTHSRASGKRTPSEHIVAHQVKGHRQSTSSRIREKDIVRAHRRASGKRTPSEHIVARQVKGHCQNTSSRIREKDTVRTHRCAMTSSHYNVHKLIYFQFSTYPPIFYEWTDITLLTLVIDPNS
jgi:hypothetical protein